ncbi:ABC transporter permease [Flagellimonas sp. 389]|uniref:ABC transporter permease n=1 Tax=Flagellimonas sp. 389 TaxID=2835862 RepID=UPI001BD55F02|nr:ABC transporter permease [Flagellimonas sp. 389]MBS9461930.1 ABC transporter permease [Flagellimonas sp. 389]
MRMLNLLKISFKAIVLNKVRALLTMLGVIIGVASVIAMLAIGEGSKQSIKAQISSMGSNMITIRPYAERQGGVRLSRNEMQSLTLDDFELIQSEASLLTNVSPQVDGNGQVIYGSDNWPSSIYGVNPEYLSIRVWEIQSGSMFTDVEVKSASKVAVIGQTVVENIFTNGEDPVGRMIRFNNIPFKVIGVLEEKGENTFGQDQDDVVLAPYTTVQKRILAIDYLQSITASAISEEQSEEAVEEVTELMNKSHEIQKGATADFEIRSMEELISTFSSTGEMLTILLVAIASISLLIGGIGIMNIMYVSVKERTREIGLRLAVGAKSSDILMQFLIEAILISITGGLIGVFLGLSTTYFIEKMLSWPTSVTGYSIVISFAVCAITGIFFGWYPARKAATLDPIEAMRYE